MFLPTHAEQSVGVQVVAVESRGGREEEGRQGKVGGGEEGEPPKKKTKVMLLQVSRKGELPSLTYTFSSHTSSHKTGVLLMALELLSLFALCTYNACTFT